MLEASNRPFATYCAAALTRSLTEQSGRSLVASCQRVYRPVKAIFGGSIPFLIASARAVRPRLASSEL
jgi:hypothetical protein